jgi:hypothetical protein
MATYYVAGTEPAYLHVSCAVEADSGEEAMEKVHEGDFVTLGKSFVRSLEVEDWEPIGVLATGNPLHTALAGELARVSGNTLSLHQRNEEAEDAVDEAGARVVRQGDQLDDRGDRDQGVVVHVAA